MFIVYVMTKSNKIEKFIFCVISPLSNKYLVTVNLSSNFVISQKTNPNLWLIKCYIKTGP
jgi:hypothetical protein